MIGQLIGPEIEELIEAKDFTSLKEVVLDWPTADIAELIDSITANDQAILFRLLPKKLGTTVYEYVNVQTQKNLLKALTQDQVAIILNEMAPDDRTALLEELPSAAVRKLLQQLSHLVLVEN